MAVPNLQNIFNLNKLITTYLYFESNYVFQSEASEVIIYNQNLPESPPIFLYPSV